MAEKREFKAYIPKIPFTKDFTGFSHNIFVGRFGYPNVNVGFLASEEKNYFLDAPKKWSEKNLSIEKIMDFRMSMLNSKYGLNVKKPTVSFYDATQEIAQTNKPADVELNLKKEPSYGLRGGQWSPPYAGTADLKKISINSNLKIPIKIQKAIYDTDWKATDSIPELFKKKIDESYLVKLLSSGSLGLEKDRKLVPTRWSITAVDDTVGKSMINKLRDFPTIDPCIYEGGYLGNYYIIILLPQTWSYELFEISTTKGQVWHDYENHNGRKNYAQETAGGYYATRMAILEELTKIKKQAGALVFRFVTNEYYQSMGVWVVREAVRKAMASKPERIDRGIILNEAIKRSVKYNYFIANLIKRSKLLKEGNQTKLSWY